MTMSKSWLVLLSGLSFFCSLSFAEIKIDPADVSMTADEMVNLLNLISKDLEEGRVEIVEERCSDSFLHSVTNANLQSVILPYLEGWIDKYADHFPESIFLYCLAQGDLDFLKKKYGNLERGVSRNCVRWSLMVNDVALDEPEIMMTGGDYCYLDMENWLASPATYYIEKVRLSKIHVFKKKGLLPGWHQIVYDSVIVSRADNVPVPWGNGMYTTIYRYPFIVTDDKYNGGQEFQKPIKHGRRITVMSAGISADTGRLRSNGDNRIWDFFVNTYSPFTFIGGQAFATCRSNAIDGKINYASKILYLDRQSKGKFKELAVPDILISPPIHFSLENAMQVTNINWSYPGVMVDKSSTSYKEDPEETRFGCGPEYFELIKLGHKRLMHKVLVLIGSLIAVSVLIIAVRRYKKD